MSAEQADSVEEWLKLARLYKANALLVLDMPGMAQLSWSSAGFACECLLKAAIMAKERLNAWPSRASRKDLHVHDLEQLGAVLGIVINAGDDVAPAWSVVTKWRRHHMYNAGEFPVPAAKGLLDAAFGEEGFEQWIYQCFLLGYR